MTRAASFPLGTIFDARHGSVRIYSQLQTGEVQAADFFGGQFQVLQSSGAGGLTEIKLVGGNFASCRVRSAAAIGRSVRHLWADGRGQFRTRGRYATAGIRGTKWLTDDRCGGTLIRVTKGAVTVRDLPRRRTVVLRAPGTYVARARR